MIYEFQGLTCPHAKTCKQGKAVCHHEIMYPVKDAPDIGAQVPCPIEGCDGMVTRVFSTSVGIVQKHKDKGDWMPGQRWGTRVNGQDINFQFLDPKNPDPSIKRNLGGLAKRQGLGSAGMSKAYYSEKHGRVVVDVASNVPDPLGKIERAKKSGGLQTTTYNPNQPYKLRKKK